MFQASAESESRLFFMNWLTRSLILISEKIIILRLYLLIEIITKNWWLWPKILEIKRDPRNSFCSCMITSIQPLWLRKRKLLKISNGSKKIIIQNRSAGIHLISNNLSSTFRKRGITFSTQCFIIKVCLMRYIAKKNQTWP